MSRTSRIIAYILLGMMLALMFFLNGKSSRARRSMDCTGIRIEIRDSARIGFVQNTDIRKILDKEYGSCIGVRLDSIRLHEIEEIMEKKSSILQCEAYTTADGLLNISILEREPVMKLITDNGTFFIDETGYIFPKKGKFDKSLPELDCHFNMRSDWKGILESDEERNWLRNLIGMIRFMESEKTWEEAFQTISIDARGNVSLKPWTGKETFLFGTPDHWEEKFDKIKDYYRYIVHEKGEGYYRTVNVRYNGQIVCR